MSLALQRRVGDDLDQRAGPQDDVLPPTQQDLGDTDRWRAPVAVWSVTRKTETLQGLKALPLLRKANAAAGEHRHDW